MTRTVPIDAIRTDGGTQIRERISEETVAEYAASIEAGDDLPPLVVYHDGSDYWLADGFHRIAAHSRLGHTDVPCEVRKGTRRDAVLFACGANCEHGLRRTNADKRRAVLALLNDEEWSKWSDHEIARRCGVSNRFVGALRPPSMNRSQMRVAERGGKPYTMNTANIGRANGAASKPARTPLAERERQIRPLAEEGLTRSQIAERLGLSVLSVRDYATRLNIPIVSEQEATAAMREQQIRDMAASGYMAAQIASELGIGEHRVRELAQRFGIELPDAALGKTRRLDPLRVIRETVNSLEGLAAGLAYIDADAVSRLDRDESRSLAEAMAESLRTINRLRKRLTENAQ